MVSNMSRQLPKIAQTALREHRCTARYIKSHNLQGVISDNRFGCFSQQAPCLFVTHQLHLRMPYRYLTVVANGLNAFFIQQFDECWVPDFSGPANLSGALSHPAQRAMPTRYIGPLSRFSQLRPPSAPIVYRTVSVLSGPEPQRTHLEAELRQQLREVPGQHLIVQGVTALPGCRREGRVEIIPYLTHRELWKAIHQSEVLISRPGYSSLMDWSFTNKRMLLIPTPGQTEQAYLAKRLKERNRAQVVEQGAIHLKSAIESAQRTQPLSLPQPEEGLLEKAIQQFLARLSPAQAG